MKLVIPYYGIELVIIYPLALFLVLLIVFLLVKRTTVKNSYASMLSPIFSLFGLSIYLLLHWKVRIPATYANFCIVIIISFGLPPLSIISGIIGIIKERKKGSLKGMVLAATGIFITLSYLICFFIWY